MVLDEQVAGDREGEIVTTNPDDTAFIQYSSGSTSDPKGVCLTNRNLTANIRAIVEGAQWTADDQSLSWMPLTHDMGLIGYHLSVLAVGMNHSVMDTSVFVRRPLLWMQKASALQATQLCSPNFGYKHFLKLFERKGLEGRGPVGRPADSQRRPNRYPGNFASRSSRAHWRHSGCGGRPCFRFTGWPRRR